MDVLRVTNSGVEEGAERAEPLSCYLKGAASPNPQEYKNHYSVVKGYFRLKAVEKPSFHKI